VNDPRSFGATLRRERERRGVTLDAIAEQTKVSVALFDALERGDLSRWPGGIFRRAFVRGYAEVVGLDAASVVETFLRVCPEEGAPVPADRVVAPQFFGGPRPLLRLTLAEEEAHVLHVLTKRRLATAAIDLGVLVLPALTALLAVGATAGWATLGLFALLYHLAGTLLAGTTPGMWLLSRPAGPAAGPVPSRPTEVASDTSQRIEETEDETDDVRRPTAEVFFTPRRRERRQVARPYPYQRRSTDSRASRR
jgi:Helix-turn-helix domain